MKIYSLKVIIKKFLDLYEKDEIFDSNVSYFLALLNFLKESHDEIKKRKLEKGISIFLKLENASDYVVEHTVFTKEKELIKISNSNFVDLEKVLSFIESRLWDLVTYFSIKECPHGCNLLRFAKVNF